MTTRSITAQLPVDLVEKLAQTAERLQTSRERILKDALGAWFAREAGRDQLTREALQSAEAGRLIDHEQVEDWLDSLGSSEAKPAPKP